MPHVSVRISTVSDALRCLPQVALRVSARSGRDDLRSDRPFGGFSRFWDHQSVSQVNLSQVNLWMENGRTLS